MNFIVKKRVCPNPPFFLQIPASGWLFWENQRFGLAALRFEAVLILRRVPNPLFVDFPLSKPLFSFGGGSVG